MLLSALERRAPAEQRAAYSSRRAPCEARHRRQQTRRTRMDRMRCGRAKRPVLKLHMRRKDFRCISICVEKPFVVY